MFGNILTLLNKLKQIIVKDICEFQWNICSSLYLLVVSNGNGQ
jgi:hypothetical protein